MKFKWVLSMAACITLAACDSGGGDGDIPRLGNGDDGNEAVENVALASKQALASSTSNIISASVVNNGTAQEPSAAAWRTTLNGDSVTVAFAENRALESIKLYINTTVAQNVYPTADDLINIEISTDNINYNSTGSDTASISCTPEIEFISLTCTYDSAVTARYLRVTVDDQGMGTNSLVRVHEIQAFSKTEN